MKKSKNNNLIIIFPIAVLIIILALVVYIALSISRYSYRDVPEENSAVSQQEYFSQAESSVEEVIEDTSKLLLVNNQNPLPENYDYEGKIVTVDKKYLCGARNQINKDVLPVVTKMLESAWSDNVELYILSPYRSYNSQATLYNAEVEKQMNGGLSREQAELKAATVVAKPGTSEHHTGLAIDFNSVEDTFENSEEFRWLTENAESYGFVLRYPKDKQDITGVIYEPWHWRYVGADHAKKMNQLDMCLEEYVEYLGLKSGG